MDLTAWIPEGLTWMAACGVGVLAIAALARTLEVVFDLDRS